MTTPTPTVGTIAEAARGLLRDFPRFFETFYPLPLASTLRLPSPLITDLTLVEPESGDPVTTGFTVDYRNGVIKLEDPTAYEAGLLAYGYHVEWFLDTDLEFYAQFTLTEHLAVRPNATVGDLQNGFYLANGTTHPVAWTDASGSHPAFFVQADNNPNFDLVAFAQFADVSHDVTAPATNAATAATTSTKSTSARSPPVGASSGSEDADCVSGDHHTHGTDTGANHVGVTLP